MFSILNIRIDELVVGAPTYSEDDNVNIGQIVIYQSINNNVSCYEW